MICRGIHHVWKRVNKQTFTHLNMGWWKGENSTGSGCLRSEWTGTRLPLHFLLCNQRFYYFAWALKNRLDRFCCASLRVLPPSFWIVVAPFIVTLLGFLNWPLRSKGYRTWKCLWYFQFVYPILMFVLKEVTCTLYLLLWKCFVPFFVVCELLLSYQVIVIFTAVKRAQKNGKHRQVHCVSFPSKLLPHLTIRCYFAVGNTLRRAKFRMMQPKRVRVVENLHVWNTCFGFTWFWWQICPRNWFP